MKKYLMTGIAALAMSGLFTSCGPDMSLYNGNQSEQVVQNYEDKFVQAFGEPAPNQTWGFGSSTVATTRGMTRSNPGVDYPSTSTGINANANEWADPDKEFGGWVVPDPLTDEQKNVVKAYFQANPNLTYQDPQWRHFFVQQVYKGGTSKPETGNKETNTDANGTSYSSDNMNLLTVGYNEQHINNFNSGNCSVNDNVLDNGGNVNSGPYHSDQIMLMVNIDDTQCFGYHNTGMSLQRNDKAALVGWETIRTWANSNGLNGDCLNDGWNRSFLGFDFELFSLQDSYVKNNGELVYAKMTDGQNGGLQYVWDGSNVVSKGVAGIADLDLTSRFTGLWNENESIDVNSDGTITYHAAQWGGIAAFLDCDIDFSPYQSIVVELAEATTVTTQFVLEYGAKGYSWNNSYKFSVDAGATQLELNFASNYVSNLDHIRQVALQASDATDLKIRKIYLKGVEGEAGFGDHLLVDGNKVPFLNVNMNQYSGIKQDINDSDMKINKDGKDCFNMEKIKKLVDEGYLPVKDKNLRTWVKWAGGDGYFSDWIVTLTKANRIPNGNSIRVIGEDLTINSNSDFDFNDIVFDVTWDKNNKNQVTIKLLAAGGELPIYIVHDDNDIFEIHNQFANANPGRGITSKTMMNTTAGKHNDYKCPEIIIQRSDDNKEGINWDAENIQGLAQSINIWVYKKGTPFMLNALEGEAPSKIAVGTDYDWCNERQGINEKYYFKEWVGDPDAANKWNTWYNQLKPQPQE